jgi:hypothetical protein
MYTSNPDLFMEQVRYRINGPAAVCCLAFA